MESGSGWHEQVLFSGVLRCVCRQSCVCAMSQAEAVTADGDGGGVMEESIQQCGGQYGINWGPTQDYRGATQIAQYDSNRHPIKSAVILTVRDGERRFCKEVGAD